MLVIVGYILLAASWFAFFSFHLVSALFSIGAFGVGIALKLRPDSQASDGARFSQVILLAGSVSTLVFISFYVVPELMRVIS